MTRKLYLLLLTLMASGLIALGCGDDDDDGGGSDEPAQEESGGSNGDEAPDVGDVTVPEEARDEALAACKQQIQSSPNIDDEIIDDLDQFCEDIVSGDPEKARKASRELCEAVAEQIPEGPGRDTAVDACKKSLGGQ